MSFVPAMSRLIRAKANFGTVPVFMTSISAIVGAILFLRFGYAVGSVGFLGTLAIIFMGHLVTIPTALAIAEIATNQKVEGGGVYYIISRSFGINIGAAIGVGLFFSQAISVAFYIIAMAEAFSPVFDFVNTNYGLQLHDKRLVSLPVTFIIALIMLTKGADFGMKTLYFVVGILFISLIMFFAGVTDYQNNLDQIGFLATIDDPDDFFYVFAICFPAFTGMAAGVGLSGDLKDPKKSIPRGTLWATVIGMLIYALVAFKLSVSATPEALVSDQLIMSQIAIWGPIIPVGLVCATISSALGSMMIAPRTLQALAQDKLFVADSINNWVKKSNRNNLEPVNATLITTFIVLVFVSIGGVNFVAEIISMFFMVTYGSICLISFLQHFAADPSYRPVFKSRWYFSLFGAVMCIYMMFKMNMLYAIAAIVFMVLIYLIITNYKKDRQGMAKIFQGVIFQLSRRLRVFIQKADKDDVDNWRPSVICISQDSFERPSALDLMRWISHRYGFGTYIHYIQGYFSKDSNQQAGQELARLIKGAGVSKSNVYMDTLISPSYTTAIAQSLQLPSVSGKDTNMFLFEYSKMQSDSIQEIIQNLPLVRAAEFDFCILGSSEKGFGFRHEIHLWITPNDYINANLMILMAYVIMGHPDWRGGQIKISAVFPKQEIFDQKEKLLDLIQTGRLPISAHNIDLIEKEENVSLKEIICEKSVDSDLTMVGLREEALKQLGEQIFKGYEDMGNILFVNANESKVIN